MDRPGTHLNPQPNVHSDPAVKSSKSSLSGEVVEAEANTNVTEVSSMFWHESERGDQLQERAARYNGARNLGLEECNVDRNNAEATNCEVTVVLETPEHEVRKASKSLFSNSMSDLATIPILDTIVVDRDQSVYHTANKTLASQLSLRPPYDDHRGTLRKTIYSDKATTIKSAV